MKVAFATVFDPRDVNRGSGTFYCLSREIERQGHMVHYIGPLREKHLPYPTRLLRGLVVRGGKRYKTYLDPFYCKARASEVSQALIGLEYDLLLTNDYGLAAFTLTDKPIILYTDAMIPRDYQVSNTPSQSRISNLSTFGRLLFEQTIRKGLHRSTLCVFPSQWIADEALQYEPDSDKIKVVPFGANIEDPGPEISERRSMSRIQKKGHIDLLFVGKDWERKGGNIAVQTVLKLQEYGINAILHVVGAIPPEPVNERYIKVYGFLNKSVPSEREQLTNLYSSCDLFILPSQSEGFVIVVLEASAYGLPVLAYDIDGVRSGVRHQVSGILLNPEQKGDDFANVISTWFSSPMIYDQLVAGGRDHFLSKVNWTHSVHQLLAGISEVIDIEPL